MAIIVTYRQCTLQEAKDIAAMNNKEYIPGTLHLYKYVDRESVQRLKAALPFMKGGE
jgi:hypothetical protein